MSNATKPLTDKQLKRQAERHEKALALALAIDQARRALVPPSELSTSGIVKTRCWVAIHDKLRRQIALKHPNRERIENLNWNMGRWKEFSADDAQRLITQLQERRPKKPKEAIHV